MFKSLQKQHLMYVIILISLVVSGCKKSQDVMVFRLAHVLDPAHPVHQGMAHFGERLSSLSNGTIKVDIYPSGQLGNERECLELVQLGGLDMAKVSSSVMENFVPAMAVFSLPYLFDDAEHYRRVFNGDIGRELLDQGKPYLLYGLCFYDAGFRSFFAREKSIETPDDLAGMKIRVMRSNLSIQTINSLGGNATPMSYGELYSALQQGVVDGAENNPPNFYQSRFYEVCKYFSLDEHSAPPDILIMGMHTWNKLTQTQRGWVEQAIQESVDFQNELWETATKEALKAVEEAGVTVVRPDKEPFRNSVASIYAEQEKTFLAEWINRIKALSNSDSTGGEMK